MLNGATYQTLHDLMRIAALGGMRISEICDLRVGSVEDGVFNVEDAKTKAGIRRVPIHSDLVVLVERRTKDKSGSDYLI